MLRPKLNIFGSKFVSEPVNKRLATGLRYSCAFLVLEFLAPIGAPVVASAVAQELGSDLVSGETKPTAQMLLEADEVTYDNDNQVVIATGNVQIAYNDYTLVAQKVRYDRNSGRVTATGSVEIVEPTGNRIHAEEIDVTDDFQDGFVSSLNIETTENTRIAAEGAERRDGSTTEFTNGVYTACEPCKKIEGNPPFWQIRARKVIVDENKETISYEDATFELFGKPIAYLPYFSHASSTAKRKSGFLIPTVSYTEELGYQGKFSYFANLAPNYDLTLTGNYYSEQGFLAEAEWRHRLDNGQYFIRLAGIEQQAQDNFDANTVDFKENDRSAIMTGGKFDINSRWRFGWNWLYQTDENFARTYDISGYSGRDIENSVYLTGVGEKNFFDLRAQQFLVQDNQLDIDNTVSGDQSYTDQQASVLPILDYNAVSDNDVMGGQLSADFNVTNISRDHGQVVQNTGYDARNQGIKGDYLRASAKAEWKKSAVVGNGALVTFSASGQVDAIDFNADGTGYSTLDNTASVNANEDPLMSSDSLVRTMPAGMLEIRYPLVASNQGVTHIFEPIGQIIVRPDEDHIGKFPNEDAQSMVFDASNLFAMNKFSGYDRVEGGTRANVGFRYSASFENGDALNITAGQSFHLAGKNSYAERDLVNAGLESGLETDRSDYVGAINYTSNSGIRLSGSGRFDEDDLSVRRAEAGLGYVSPDFSFTTSYIFTDKQPEYGLDQNRHEVRGGASLKLDENWRTFGSIAYDLEESTITSESIGLAYDNECTTVSVSYSNSRDRYTGTQTDRSINFSIGLRTLGDYGYTHDVDLDNTDN